MVELLELGIDFSEQFEIFPFGVLEVLGLDSLEIYCDFFMEERLLFVQFVGFPLFELEVVELGVFEFFEDVQNLFVHQNSEKFFILVV